MTKKRFLLVLSLLAISWSLYSLLHRPAKRGLPDLAMQRRYADMGRIVGEETAKALAPGTTVVLGQEPQGVWATQAQLPGFLQALKQGGIKVEQIYRMKLETWSGSPVAYLTTEQWDDIQKRYPNLGAIILFEGVPAPPMETALAAMTPRPRLLVVGAENFNVQPLLNQGIVTWALVHRFEPLSDGTLRPQTAREQFEHDYQLLNPATQR